MRPEDDARLRTLATSHGVRWDSDAVAWRFLACRGLIEAMFLANEQGEDADFVRRYYTRLCGG